MASWMWSHGYSLKCFLAWDSLLKISTSKQHKLWICEKLESVQYKVVLATTDAIQGTSREKTFMELGFESLRSRRWFRRLCCMFKIMKDQAPEYLNNLIPKRNRNFKFRNIYIPSYNCLTEYFKSSFFPASLEEWFHLDPSIRNSETINAFKQILLLSFVREKTVIPISLTLKDWNYLLVYVLDLVT